MDNSHQYITPILAALFTAEHRRLETAMVRLHQANIRAWNQQGDGFIYMGEAFIPKGTPKGKRNNLPLHLDLWGEADAHLADRRIIENDGAQIQQLLFKLLEPCGYTGSMAQDVRDAIPECIIDIMHPDTRALSRMREPVALLNHPRDWKFYERVLPKLEFYSAARLLY